MALTILVLVVLGLSAGSFVNALVWRLHEQSRNKKKDKKLSVINGRSMCTRCKHTLAWYDLIPLFSWLRLKGKCRYCSKPIEDSPLVELAAALVFVGSYVFWPVELQAGQWVLFTTWLISAVGLLALAVYDLRWMILPNKIIYPTLLAAIAGRAVYIVIYAGRPLHSLLLWVLSVAVASGAFFVLFVVSKGKWIGYGDVRLGLITGTLLATPQKSLAMIFLASLIGSLAVVPSLAAGKRTMASRLPYGPFLIAAAGIMVLFGDSLINWYKNLIV